ncbi:MAG TPA: YkgJ family cysteine cluster protein [Planctomycetota bacterium]|nr:YkgJ family cysteine cluster protein [Planctomycetota bacterium]
MGEAQPGEYWFAEGIRFECRRCGTCCRGEPGYVWVTTEEIRRMAEHLGMAPVDFAKEYVRREGTKLSLKEHENGDCVLWKESCVVYECRPAQCRGFPFWTHALKSKAAFAEVTRTCPGVGTGRLYTVEDILAIAAGLRDT